MTPLPEDKPLPSGWRRVRLGEICALSNGDAYKPSDWSNEGTRIVRIENLNDELKPFNHWAGDTGGRVLIDDGDLLLAWSGTPGTSFGAHTWDRGPALLNQHIFRLDLRSDDIERVWLVHAINNRLSELIAKAHGGVGLRHVKKAEVEALVLCVPPKGVQQEIASMIERQLVTIGCVRAAAEEQRRTVARLASAFLRWRFADSTSWGRLRSLGDIADVLPSSSIALDGDAEVTVITTGCLTETGFNPKGLKRARMWSNALKRATPEVGEVLVARSNTPDLVGRAALFTGAAVSVVVSDLTFRIRAREVSAEYLSAYLSYLFVSGYWKEKAGGASGTMKKISRSQLLQVSVPDAPVLKQRDVIGELKVLLAGARSLNEEIGARLNVLRALEPQLVEAALRCDRGI